MKMQIELKTPHKNGWDLKMNLRGHSGAFFLEKDDRRDTKMYVHGTEDRTLITLVFSPPSPGHFLGELTVVDCRFNLILIIL
jgi:hypothetical protein